MLGHVLTALLGRGQVSGRTLSNALPPVRADATFGQNGLVCAIALVLCAPSLSVRGRSPSPCLRYPSLQRVARRAAGPQHEAGRHDRAGGAGLPLEAMTRSFRLRRAG
jgi:hypothetical protein